MPIRFDSVFVTATGSFLPGQPVANDDIDRFIAPLNATSARIKRRILAENGIVTRHYAIDDAGATVHSTTQMAAAAINNCITDAHVTLQDVTILCTGSSGGDLAMPGFANMLQGELHAPPMTTSTHQGVCAAGMAAMQHAATALELSESGHALVAASEMPSRMFKRSRFAPRQYETDFDSHFLRWMLSDGAGACLLSRQPRNAGLSLKLRWIHNRSFSGDLPVCMQIGKAADGSGPSYLDYASLADAEADGAFLLRQDVRLLPNLFELGIHEYATLVQQDVFRPEQIDHFLCHYSSQKFAGVVEDLMQRAGLAIPRDRWYSNLTWRGNTGAASIFIMLADFVRERELKPGQQILCFVPESGRFSVSFMQLEVVPANSSSEALDIAPPHEVSTTQSAKAAKLVQALASVWHDYRSRAWRTPLVQKITTGQFTNADYVKWMGCWIPQVREGSRWMVAGADHLDEQYSLLATLVRKHAGEEHNDFKILFDDYRLAGGTAQAIEDLRRNPGGEALNAYMHGLASQSNPFGLLGAIYIIEGTGQRIIPALLPLLKQQLELPAQSFRFLTYHGDNDVSHLARWLSAVEMAIELSPGCEERILAVARATADLYVLQMEHVL
ncbi:3-oxoacyl-[acyl-carrier-protein] synthase III C-terminal domain-containing protein [Steroidobacter sp.]|uniref:3-oxoacyl-[acyl-carrier-protein] synthase III C-terminal domain-containing protein n=1 Tax=Steroidobacter sp. TaxID=1978227 RepID=UPI001A510D23|nr:iron-containing redox enzyme family protein [Steroidobacter sp.]MBL8271028.1 iron-containing redox enzyme family protein [Steroidobacter sp.]